jgi:hypothetical protein
MLYEIDCRFIPVHSTPLSSADSYFYKFDQFKNNFLPIPLAHFGLNNKSSRYSPTKLNNYEKKSKTHWLTIKSAINTSANFFILNKFLLVNLHYLSLYEIISVNKPFTKCKIVGISSVLKSYLFSLNNLHLNFKLIFLHINIFQFQYAKKNDKSRARLHLLQCHSDIEVPNKSGKLTKKAVLNKPISI